MEFNYEGFSYWFRCTLEPGVWDILENGEADKLRGTVNICGPEVDWSLAFITDEEQLAKCKEDFTKFQARPEYMLGQPCNVVENRFLAEVNYQTLLMAIYLVRSVENCKSLDEMRARFVPLTPQADFFDKKMHKLIDWIKETDFYEAPASSRYHEAHVGGLLQHSLKVYNRALEIRKIDSFKNITITSIALAALTHDWCKINYYEKYMKNVKDEETGQWHQEEAFRVNQKGIPLGHGVSSMFLASKFFNLTPEESLAIRWHMGHWRVTDAEVDELQKANETCPLVHLIQFADQLALVNY